MAKTSRLASLASVSLIAFAFVMGCDVLRGREEDAGPAPVAPKEMAAAKTAPKPRAAPPVPPLPDLPVLDAQEKAPAAPPNLKSAFGVTPPTSGGCGGLVWNGNEVMALPCAKNGVLFGRDAKGARALVSSKLLDADRAAMPAIVNHQYVGFEGPVRDQKTSPACTAFALAAATDQAVARWTGKPSSVSVMPRKMISAVFFSSVSSSFS